MKPTMVNHELRVIHFNYKSDSPLTEFESNAVVEYLKMHNELASFYNRHKKIKETYYKLQPIVITLEDELASIESEVKRWGSIAGYIDESEESREFLKDSENFKPLIQRCLEHQDKMELYFEDFNKLGAEYRKWDVESEKMEEKINWYEEKYYNPIFEDYQNMEIDWVTFEEDLQEFYKVYDDLFRKINNEFVKIYNDHANRIKSYIGNIDVIFSRIELIQRYLNKLSAETDLGGFGVN